MEKQPVKACSQYLHTQKTLTEILLASQRTLCMCVYIHVYIYTYCTHDHDHDDDDDDGVPVYIYIYISYTVGTITYISIFMHETVMNTNLNPRAL